MKKPTFIITEVLLSLCLVASASAVGIVAYDLKTNNIGLDKYNPFAVSETGNNDTSKLESSAKENSESSKQESSKETSQQQSSKQESSQQESSAAQTTVQFRSQPTDLTKQPDELVKNLKAYGFDIDYNVVGDRLIMVQNDGSKAKVYCYAKSESGIWWNVIGDGQPITESAYVGENGTAFTITEGSKKTPSGIFFMGDAFYIGEKPNSSYSMFEITQDTYWVTDSNSAFYNQRVNGTDDKDWNTAIRMAENEKSYKYGITVHYNDKQIKADAGSAIFLQCGTEPTSGGIAVPENVMKSIIEWLDETNLASIFITTA